MRKAEVTRTAGWIRPLPWGVLTLHFAEGADPQRVPQDVVADLHPPVVFLLLGCRHLSPGTESAHGAAGGGGGGGQGRAGGGQGGGWGRGRAAVPPSRRPAPPAGSLQRAVRRRRSPWRGGQGSLGGPPVLPFSRGSASAWGARPPARRRGLPELQRRAAALRLLSSAAEFLPAAISPNRYSWGGVPLSLRFRGDRWALGKPTRARQLCGWLLVRRELKHGRGHRPAPMF